MTHWTRLSNFERNYFCACYQRSACVITAVCFSIALLDHCLRMDLRFQWKQKFGNNIFFQSQLPQLVCWFIHFSLRFVCFLCSCFRLSTFHQRYLQILELRMRRVTWNRLKICQLTHLSVAFVETIYLNAASWKVSKHFVCCWYFVVLGTLSFRYEGGGDIDWLWASCLSERGAKVALCSLMRCFRDQFQQSERLKFFLNSPWITNTRITEIRYRNRQLSGITRCLNNADPDLDRFL